MINAFETIITYTLYGFIALFANFRNISKLYLKRQNGSALPHSLRTLDTRPSFEIEISLRLSSDSHLEMIYTCSDCTKNILATTKQWLRYQFNALFWFYKGSFHSNYVLQPYLGLNEMSQSTKWNYVL